tara:strand:+ start:401 stop:652 length:252 start_codon:yes stop_codon:yes gene_type:complete
MSGERPKKIPKGSIGPFSDGYITESQYQEMMRDIRSEGKYLSPDEHDKLVALTTAEGTESLTRFQYVQYREAEIFRLTGVTRD